MKKNIGIFTVVLSMVFFLTACGKSKLEADTTGEAYVKTVLYGKESPDFEKAFDIKPSQSKKILDNEYVPKISMAFEQMGVEEKKGNEIAKKLIKTAIDKTKYKAKVVKETKEEAVIEYSINGFDDGLFNKTLEVGMNNMLIELVNKEGNLKIKDVDELNKYASDEGFDLIEKVLKKMGSDPSELEKSLIEEIKKLDVSKESEPIVLTLSENPDKPNTWKVEQEEDFILLFLDAVLF